MKLAMRHRACNFFVVILQRNEIWSSKLSSESKIPSKVSFVLVAIDASPADTHELELFSLKSKWHFPGLFLDDFI